MFLAICSLITHEQDKANHETLKSIVSKLKETQLLTGQTLFSLSLAFQF